MFVICTSGALQVRLNSVARHRALPVGPKVGRFPSRAPGRLECCVEAEIVQPVVQFITQETNCVPMERLGLALVSAAYGQHQASRLTDNPQAKA